MLDMGEVLGVPKPKNKNLGLAMLLRMLAQQLENEEEVAATPVASPFAEPEIRTRPHFTPSGG